MSNDEKRKAEADRRVATRIRDRADALGIADEPTEEPAQFEPMQLDTDEE